MTPALALPRPATPSGIRDTNLIPAAAMLLAAILIRCPHFGNPMLYMDEQFYLLVGDRMLHGALPYVDIWDRKPVGLFLIYAAIRLLGGDGILEYQLVATLFAAATAFVIYRMTRRPAGEAGALIAGVAYLLWIETVEGGGGQSPTFYNLFVAITAACTLAAREERDGGRFATLSLVAMASAGVAIQVKYTALFEGVYFGLLLAWESWVRAGSAASALRRIALLALLGLAPTLAAFAFYAAIGEAETFWFANFTSVFARAPADPHQVHSRLLVMTLHALPLTVCALASGWHLRATGDPAARSWPWLMAGWWLAALAGFFSVGMMFVHYMLPLFVPFVVAAAPIFRRRPLGWVLAFVILAYPLRVMEYPDRQTPYYQRQEAALEALVPADVRTGCMHMFGGPPILYFRTGACTLTRYVFPNHLVSRIEVPALGIDAAAELARVLSLRPRVLVTDDRAPELTRLHYGMVRQAVRRDYRAAGHVVVDGRRFDVWVSRRPAYSPSLSSRD